MKKQILFLAFLLVAVFSGMKNTYAQTYTNYLTAANAAAIQCAAVTPLPCIAVADPLHPIPGQSYTYTVNVAPAPAGTTIHWFVTDNPNVIAAAALTTDIDVEDGDYVLAAGAEYNVPANGTNTIQISWKSFNATTHEVLLVTFVTDAAGCTNNIEVYRIEPTFSFTLDIAALADNGAFGASECVSPVESATYTGGTDLTMNYGENWIFFSVNAANFVDSWLPSFQTNYTGAGTVGTVEWAYPADALANTAWHAATVPVAARDASGAVGAAGECIVLRVQIDHADDEIIAATVLTMGVNGTMFDPAAATGAEYANAAFDDLGPDGTDGDNLCDQVDFDDEIDYTITPRPAVTTATIGVAPNPNPAPFEPKN